jgi:hypothetical protein
VCERGGSALDSMCICMSVLCESVWMDLQISICMYLHAYAYVCVLLVCVCKCECVYVWCACMGVHMYECVSLCVGVRVFTHMPRPHVWDKN